MANKIAFSFKQLASKAFTNPTMGQILIDSSVEEQVAFHKLHASWIKKDNLRRGQEELLRERYPFIKVNGSWYVSSIKLYLYLFAARDILAEFEDDDMQACYSGIQAARRYYEEAKALDLSLSPDLSTVENYEDYQRRLGELYRDYCMEQSTIFGG